MSTQEAVPVRRPTARHRQKGTASRSRPVARWRAGIVVAGCAAVPLAVRLPAVLPDKYYYDARLIRALADHVPQRIRPDASFRSTAALYGTFGLADRPLLTTVLGLAVFTGALLVAVPAPTVRWHTALLTVTCLGPAAVYLTQPSKDAVVLVLSAATLLVLRRRPALWPVGGLLVLYSCAFRSYWVITAALFAGLWLAMRRGRSVWALAGLVAFGFVVLGEGYALLRGQSLDAIRALTNDARTSGATDQVTEIPPWVPAPAWVPVGMLNSALTCLVLLIPVPLALLGGGAHLVAAGFLLWFSARLLVAARRCLAPAADPGARLAVALLLAFVATQALFVPDFGSYLKHLTPMLPLGLYAFARLSPSAPPLPCPARTAGS